MEIIGKLKVFQYFLTKILENLMFSNGFSTQAGLGRPKPGQGLVQKLFPYPSEPFCDDIFSIPAEQNDSFDTSAVSLIPACLLKKAVMPSQAHQQKKQAAVVEPAYHGVSNPARL